MRRWWRCFQMGREQQKPSLGDMTTTRVGAGEPETFSSDLKRSLSQLTCVLKDT